MGTGHRIQGSEAAPSCRIYDRQCKCHCICIDDRPISSRNDGKFRLLRTKKRCSFLGYWLSPLSVTLGLYRQASREDGVLGRYPTRFGQDTPPTIVFWRVCKFGVCVKSIARTLQSWSAHRASLECLACRGMVCPGRRIRAWHWLAGVRPPACRPHAQPPKSRNECMVPYIRLRHLRHFRHLR